MKYLIGIDEAGRGPLAGPVAVGAVIVGRDFDWKLVAGAKDSKQMTQTSREILYSTMSELRNDGKLDFAVGFSAASVIDRQGIVPAIFSALRRALKRLNVQGKDCEVRLDGNLKAPKQFIRQTTIIRGDESEPIISLASIVTKVERDALMTKMSRHYPLYQFEQHKGYGTLKHRALIREHGFSKIHRTTFCTRLLLGSKAV